MASGATSLNLVRDELFATMEEAETHLEHFIEDRHNSALLQQAIEALKQIRGTLTVVELIGAELLADQMLELANDIPSGVSQDRDEQLAALNNALHVLKRYIEGISNSRQEMPELLLPAINELRHSAKLSALPESYFFSVRLDSAKAPFEHSKVDINPALCRRLRQMYQVGLLGFLREESVPGSIKLMDRAVQRLEKIYQEAASGRFFWIAGAAFEAQAEGKLLLRKTRKQLFSRLDREIRQVLADSAYEPPRSLVKELLYVVALTDIPGVRAQQVREVFNITPLPFTDHLLEDQYQRLRGPGHAVMRSLSSAIREELTSVKDMLDLAERGNLQEESVETLYTLLGKLSKTLMMVGLNSPANVLNQQLPLIKQWVNGVQPDPATLSKLAEQVLYVESVADTLEQGEAPRDAHKASVNEVESFAEHQLLEAQIVVVSEAQAGLAMARRSITAYLESGGDKQHLANVPFALQSVRGGLWFLNQSKAASLASACAHYIERYMLESSDIPAEAMLETLADALSSLEYYLESGATLQSNAPSGVLDLAAQSVAALGLQVSE